MTPHIFEYLGKGNEHIQELNTTSHGLDIHLFIKPYAERSKAELNLLDIF